RISLNFASLRLCDLALYQRNEKDAMTQGRKDWKPQNPSESEKCYFIFLQALIILVASILRPMNHTFLPHRKRSDTQ
ncbi:MAG: hypothetical protein U9N46_14940, partial [Euryarchaeota archaeon]|nr:hypothetical protein [Euryarchaeota archaeon]